MYKYRAAHKNPSCDVKNESKMLCSSKLCVTSSIEPSTTEYIKDKRMTLPNKDQIVIGKETTTEDIEIKVSSRSSFFNSNPPTPFPNFTEVETGAILGKGRFGTVREVVELPNQSSSDSDSDDDRSTADYSDERVSVTQTKKKKTKKKKNCKGKYVVKGIRDGLLYTDEEKTALADLATEARLLSSFSHSNIIRIHGTLGEVGEQDFMLILDRLYFTLNDKLDSWKAEQKSIRNVSMFGLRKKKFRKTFRIFVMKRLVAAYDIASVLHYLHEKKIIYRDLKPDNIGYDFHDSLRIFDFGCAKELKKEDLICIPEDYNCTAAVGTPIFMAPEVYAGMPYGPSADVYSFGLLMWNMLSLKLPFNPQTSIPMHFNDVVVNNKRPANLEFVPAALDDLMNHCWGSQRENRPSFETICSVLRREIVKLQQT